MSLKSSFGKVIYQLWSGDHSCEMEISIYIGHHFETVNTFFFFWFMVYLGVYRYGASFVTKFLWENSLEGSPVGNHSPC